ncbi:WecB/TagA/CpsF family glycosyltransferase [Methylorubrum salsuginis]|uniref:N-acetylglucosaminyldiphosphoundecaprenol N-acetyl-beta-D-mannosaminyltransferase n=1 Tax=Methylorubrum salsuginis TaxID=414703 RepID=A0A1I4L8F0_9HYPH|nr:WecB/TagA/CpsF family glycosyltransferase [Methylorubrum salsuginis]SFL87318.1 N-acetylglucosaminyldiphosphoundecaprenol N-acetyl-beta-D-mannosaminyltransferase [Methylorubrum salsuginis]
MSHDPAVPRFRLAGTGISAIDMKGMIGAIRRRLDSGRTRPGTFVVFRDAHGIVRATEDEKLLAAHEAAMLVCPDGRPLYWLGRLRGADGIGQVPGIESVEAVCRAGLVHGWRHYFLGGGEGVADALARTMQARLPGLQVVGTETPPFRPLDAAETDAMRARIRESGAQILWIGLGTPKQELFMAEHAPHLPGTVAMGVGAAFDVLTGRVPRAPVAFQVTGLEWAYRLMREPRRLTGRYLHTIPRFLALVATEHRRRPAGAARS